MKLILLFLCFTMTASLAEAQSTRYKKTMDDPGQAINSLVSIAPFNASIASGKYAALTVGLEAAAVYGFTNRIGFEGNAETSYISTNDGQKRHAEAGAFLNFVKKEKVKNTRVLLSYKRTADVFTRTETTSYLEVPVKAQIATGLRGGAYYNSFGIKTDGIKIAAASSRVNQAGVYAGIQTTNKHLIKTQLAGEKEPSPTGAIFKLYADALLLPFSKIEDPMLASKIETGNIGGRAGIMWVIHPYTKKQSLRYNPLIKRLIITSEIGSVPVEGFYFKGGVAWGILYK